MLIRTPLHWDGHHAEDSDDSTRRRGRRRRSGTHLGLAGSLIVVGAVIAPGPVAIADPSEGFIDDVPDTTPASLGDLDLTELQYADPAEALDLIQPPRASVDGAASLSYPLGIPSGRADVAPELGLDYDSSGGNGWVGVGWDLSMGAVTVDTEFGAPRYLRTKESETYLLDGDRLFPNAIRSQLIDRNTTGRRADWVRQVDGGSELIVRHGTTPSTYCWEVVDVEGNHSWYGGVPDDVGGCVRDESAILTAPATGVDDADDDLDGVAGDFHWALTYVEDISGNTMRLTYDEVTGVPIGQQSSAAIGVSLYLREILYTGFALDTAPDRPAYRIRFLRDGDVTGETPRRDVSVDASAGSPVVVRDLLRGIEVHHLSRAFYESGAAEQLVKGWTLEYANGPFDKSLLQRVGQYGTGGAGTEHSWHEFTWFDEVTDENGDYRGFGDPQRWGTRDNTDRVNIAAESALGTSWRAGGDGGAYIGFNPIIPSKLGSFGGSFNIAGGESNIVSTLVDLDGDSLPDKVAVDTAGIVSYRRNLGGPGGATSGDRFGVSRTITGINGLGKSSDLRIDVHFEAYPVVTIQVGGGFGFSFGNEYFEDVNGDGRVDFIKPGSSGGRTVFYNVLQAGVPTFIDSSLTAQLADTLEVPLDEFVSDLADAEIDEVSQLIVNTSPRVDTVRRWLAPHNGTVRVDGTATLLDAANYQGDGAQVSIEHAGNQAWLQTLSGAAPSSSHAIELAVNAGDAVYFRLHVIENAADDAVQWDPTITYLDAPGGSTLTASPDANNRSQASFVSSDDFTLFGRVGARTALSEEGTFDVDVAVDVLEPLSDGLQVLLVQGRGDATTSTSTVLDVAQRTTGTFNGTTAVTVTAPTTDPGDDGVLDTNDDTTEADWIEVHVRSDSPVDPTAFSIDISTSAVGADPPPEVGDIPADADVDIPLDIPIVPNVRVFARTDHVVPYVPVTSPNQSRMDPATIDVAVQGPPMLAFLAEQLDSPAVLTVKTLDGGVVARAPFTVEDVTVALITRLEGGVSLTGWTPDPDTTYYIDVSIADPTVGSMVDLVASTVTWNWTVTEQNSDGDDVDVAYSSTVANAGQLHWPDIDGIFPSGNRGWAYAGYNADHNASGGSGPLVESQFEFEAETEGFDEDTEVPTASGAPGAGEVKQDVGNSFDPSFAYIPWAGSGSDIADRWRAAEKETLNGQRTTMQADRLGADVAIEGQPVAGRQAPQILSVSGDFNFMLGLVASFTAAVGGGRELKGFEDYNGDGYPDIRSGSDIEYTGPRGGKAATQSVGDNPFDLSLAVGGGLSGSAISISNKGPASPNDDGGGEGSNVEPTSTRSSRGMNVGIGAEIKTQWTNPLANGEAYSEISGGDPDEPDITGDLDDDRADINVAAGASGTPIDRSFIDINGDGLPDRVDTYTSGELWVNLNLGYRFSDAAIQWSTGRTASNKDVGGTLSVGFQINAYEFGGGIAYSEGVGYSLFSWTDIDGDGVPDRMNNVGGGQPRTVFGSGDGMLRNEIVYGTFPNGNVAVDAARAGGFDGVTLPTGQMEVSRSTGLTGGFDFSFYIGPICLVACYIVINPGAHGGYDRQTSQVQMIDMNGDGYLDAVRSTDYEHVEVRLNLRGRTNMLETVTNPLGGQIRLGYERTGNTIVNPESVWVMSSVDVDDGRSGDGADVQRSEFVYAGNAYDPLLRELMGFSSITERQLDTDGTVLRSYERDYLNANPFETGTLTEERTFDGSGSVVRRASFGWTFVDSSPTSPAYGQAVGSLPSIGTTARLALFDLAVAPRLITDSLAQIDQEGHVQSVTTHYTYNSIGDVVTVWDQNEGEISGDDTFTTITYSDCATRSGDRLLGADESWVSVPQTVTVYGNDQPSGEILRYRNGGPQLCDNATPIRIAELVQPAASNICGTDLFAITEMSFDTHGSYNSVAGPSNRMPDSCVDYPPETIADSAVAYDGCSALTTVDDARRACVDYVYDDHRFTSIAAVTDNHGVSSSASYDPVTGRLATRVDESGNLTTYTYDAAGRVASITAPREQGSGNATVSYQYGPLDATLAPGGPHVWAGTSHHDIFNVGNTIDTTSFVDGMGRVVQRKRDASVDGVAGESRIVEGAVEFDALGREIAEWYPVVEIDADFGRAAYNTWTSELGPAVTNVPTTSPTRRVFDALDRLRQQTLPDGSDETVTYDVDILPDSAALYGSDTWMSRIVSTDPLGKTLTRWLDVGGAVFRRVDGAAAVNDPDGGGGPLDALPSGPAIGVERIADSVGTAGAITTVYDYDRLGRLIGVVDAAGAQTTHAYDLQDGVTSTDTPDAGLVARTFAPSGQLLTVERAVGTVATYAYDRDRLIGVDYSDSTPDVTYEYGDDGAPENAAGRVTRVIDGAMDRSYGYDVDGNVARETATEDDNPFGISVNPVPTTWTTQWRYDSLGRLDVLTYPDGEALAHDYDLGGRPTSLVAQAPQHDLYDQYGVAVPRDDVEIVYVDEVRYDEFGEPTFLRTGTGAETSYEREPARRFLTGIDSDSTATVQYDGTLAAARPLQRLEYTYDAVGNVRDVVNGLYREAGDAVITDVAVPPENNVPGASHHAFTYDGHYRITAASGTYIDRKENRGFTYEADYAANGNLLEKRQVTTTTSTTGGGNDNGNGGGGNGNGGGGNGGGNSGPGKGKKGDGSGTTGGTTDEPTCESNTGSGGGSFNQDPETTYVLAAGDLVYATDGVGNSIHQLVEAGERTYTYDANGNMTGWIHPCAGGRPDISRTMEYDAENRIIRLAEDNNDTDYRYNAEGARTLERGPGGTTWWVNEHWRTVNDGHRYALIYVGEQLVASHRTSPADAPPPPCTDTIDDPCGCDDDTACRVPIAECDLTSRVYDETSGTCQPSETRTIHFFHKDLQGSMRVATDEVGDVFQYMDYLPTGRPWVAGQSRIKDTPYLFAGGWTDITYKIVNFGERWYDPREQNFLSPEPLLEDNPYAAVDDPSLLAAYTYASANPMRFVDPDGRAPFAANGFDLGTDFDKHQSGNISISVAQREQRAAPKITFGGRYTNDARGQELADAFEKHNDRAERFSTILSISTEDGVRTIRVLGGTVSEQPVPDAGPGATGAEQAEPVVDAPNPGGAAPQPDADDAAEQAVAVGDAAVVADGAGDAGAAAPPPDDDAGGAVGGDGGGNDGPPPVQPPAGAVAAPGPDDD